MKLSLGLGFLIVFHSFSAASAAEAPLKPAKYLKVWNETFTHADSLRSLNQYVSSEYKTWLTHQTNIKSLHRSSIEFMGQDQFFLKTENGQMNLINTSKLDEGQVLIMRKPFNFTAYESLEDISKRLSQLSGTGRSSAYWAPLLAVIDIQRNRDAGKIQITPPVQSSGVRRSFSDPQGLR